jgi:beta-galactosidase
MPPESLWRQDFERIRRAGMSVIRFFPVWAWLEPAPDRFQFDPIERFFDLAERNNLKVLFSFATGFDAPAWLYKEYPDLRPILNHGEYVEPHARAAFPLGGCFPCTDHPIWRKRHENLVRKTVPRFAGRPNLLYWHVWDEPHVPGPSSFNRPGFGCYCPHTIERYHRWLEKNYKVEQLNEVWGTGYSALGDINPPRSVNDIPGMLLWKLFLRRNLAETVQWAVELVRGLDPEHPTYASSNHDEPGGSGGFLADCCSDPQIAGIPDIYSTNLHTDGLPPDSAEFGSTMFNFLAIDWKRSITGGRFWIDELFSTPILSSMKYLPKASPKALSINMWASAAGGAHGLLFWQYRPEYRSFEGPAFGLTDLWGNPTERFKLVEKTISQMESISEHFPLQIPGAEAAILYHEDSDILLNMGQLAGTDLLCGLYYTFWKNNIPLDVITPEMDWHKYRIIILPDIVLMDEQIQNKILGIIKSGSEAPFILCAGLFALYNSQGILSLRPPEGLADILDIRLLEISAIPEDSNDSSALAVKTGYGSFSLQKGQGYPLLETGNKSQIIAGINEETVGAGTSDGRFMWIPVPRTRHMPEDAVKVILNILKEKGVTAPLAVEPEHLLVRMAHSRKEGKILIIFNLHKEPVQAKLRGLIETHRVVDLINKKTIDVHSGELTFRVDSEGVSIFHI